VVTLCNKEGDLIFGANDIEALNSAIKASDLEKIVEKAQELNAISEQDKEEILKNSDVGQEDNSSSGSVNN